MATETREERQIREAFIDGFKAGRNNDYRRTPEQAWAEDNETGPSDTVSVPVGILRLVVDGGAPDQAALNQAVADLRACFA